MFFPVNIPMCPAIDTHGISALLWWYVIAYWNINISWFKENLYARTQLLKSIGVLDRAVLKAGKYKA